jgi:uncharacterized cofD-like protein
MGDGYNHGDPPRIVVLGGGTGLSVMLRGLKHKPLHITAIVTLGDDGGSSGILRSEMDMPPPGDIRNVLIALADVEPMLSKMLQFRFPSGSGLAGHSLGNLIIAAMKEISGDFVAAIKALSKVLAVRGQVLPATADAIVLRAELEDGRVIVGESNIPRANGRIRRMMIEPADAKPLDEALEAIREADAILVGPGSLYTSIIPNLLVPQIARAIRESPAVKLFVCNIMTQPGETDGYTVSDHLNAIFRHVGHHLFDYVIVNNGEIPQHVLDRYAQEGAVPVRIDENEIGRIGCRMIADRLFEYRQYLRHDAALLSDHIYRLVLAGMRGMRK